MTATLNLLSVTSLQPFFISNHLTSRRWGKCLPVSLCLIDNTTVTKELVRCINFSHLMVVAAGSATRTWEYLSDLFILHVSCCCAIFMPRIAVGQDCDSFCLTRSHTYHLNKFVYVVACSSGATQCLGKCLNLIRYSLPCFLWFQSNPSPALSNLQ